mgnify:CR=1 FL=1
MNCIITDFNVYDDVDNVIKKLINRVSKSNISESLKILTYFDSASNTDFRQFVLDNLVDNNKEKYNIKSIEDLTNSKIAEINQNTLESLIRSYYIKQNPNAALTVRKNDYMGLDGFTSFTARSTAKAYTALKIINIYNSDVLSKNRNLELKDAIKNIIKREFFEQYVPNFAKIVSENKNEYFTKNLVNIANEVLDCLNKSKEYNNELDKIAKLISIGKYNNADINLRKSLLEKRKENGVLLNKHIRTLFKSVPVADYTKFVNMFNLWQQVTYNTLDWLRYVEHSKSLGDVFKKLNKELTEYEKLDEYFDVDENEEIIINNEDSIDEYSKNWADQMLKSFDQQVSKRVRNYINDIPTLTLEYDKSGKAKYVNDTNNELGVNLPMDGRYLLTQLSTKCNFASPEAFVASLEKISAIPYLYGVAKIVEDVKKDELLRNELFVELNNYPIDKIQIGVEGDTINKRLSNSTKDARTAVLFNLRNGIISTYKYFLNDDVADERYNIIFDSKNIIRKNISDEEIGKNLKFYIRNKFKTQFPSIDGKQVEEFLKRVSKDDLINTAKYLKLFDSVITRQRDKYKELSSQYVKNKADYDESVLVGKRITFKNPFEGYDINGDFSTQELINIAEVFAKYVPQEIQLNHYNAEGNLSTDLITQNKITNLLRQIQYTTLTEDGKIEYTGLKKLREFCLKSPMYSKNTFLFGIRDRNGNIKQQGLFDLDGYNTFIDKDNDGLNAHINPDARSMIEIALFDGVSNRSENNSATYNNLGKIDYFISLLNLYGETTNDKKSSIRFYRNSDRKELKGFALPTPSDAPKQFVAFIKPILTNNLFNNSSSSINGVNINSEMFLALRQILVQEIKDFYKGLNDITDDNGLGKQSIDGLFENYHYIKNKLFNGERLIGHVFNFTHIPSVGNYNLNEAVLQLLNVYGNNNSIVKVNKDKSNFQIDKSNLKFDEYNDVISKGIDEIIANWVNSYKEYINKRITPFRESLNENISDNLIYEFAYNNVVQFNNFDDLFTGDSKFYKDADDQFKRFKEVQAGGKQNGAFNLSDDIDTFISDDTFDICEKFDIKYKRVDTNGKEHKIIKQNGFKAITIENNLGDAVIEEIYNETKDIIYKRTGNIDLAERQGHFVAEKYKDIKADDAQSYITFDEFIRRRYNDGTLEKYKDIVKKILTLRNNRKANGTYDISKFNENELTAFIQIEKNFYYDITFDESLGIYVPRQIKNAEFVLIPELLPNNSPLRKLYDFMIRNDIQQVNTKETDKASKKNVLKLFNDDGTFINENDADSLVNNLEGNNYYYYKHLYKQQNIVSHLKDKENKIGLQFARKILDNIPDELADVEEAFQSAYSDNIKLSKEELFKEMGWTDADIINGTADLTKFYKRAERQGVNLGMNSNFYDFVTLDVNGVPIMDNDLSTISSKLESIALSLFNSEINRQTVPGFHVTQIAGDKFRKIDGTPLQYHPKNDKGEREPYMEILIPRNSYNIPKTIEYVGEDGKTYTRDFLPSDLPKELQEIILYRIPTEGKQSMTIGRIVGFLDDIYDSTIVVPREWIGQTGSDNDGDSVYAIQHKVVQTKDENGKIIIKAADNTQRDINNNTIVESAKTILRHESSREENYLSSNFDDIKTELASLSKPNISAYDIFTHIDKMDNAMSGANLKGISVFRDSFTSLAGKGRTIVGEKNDFSIIYKLNIKGKTKEEKDANYEKRIKELKDRFGEINVTEGSNYRVKIKHKMFGWSFDNRNVDGHLITAYSSQTTAHILDAIKVGTIMNENEYTFGVFKTLVDMGSNYHVAMNFLVQPAISYINNEYALSNSLYNKTYSRIIPNAIKTMLANNGIKVNNKEINKYTKIDDIINTLIKDENFIDSFSKITGFDKQSVSIILKDAFSGKYSEGFTTINQGALENRNNGKLEGYDKIAFDLYNIFIFDNLKQLSNYVEKINRLSRVDKVGTKTSVFETKQLINDINDEYEDTTTDPITGATKDKYAILSAQNSEGDYSRFIRSLYSDESFYPFLNAYYNNSTTFAAKLGEQIFATETEQFDKLYNYAANVLGVPLTKELQKALKKYYISNIFNYIPEITKPIIVNKFGIITFNYNAIHEYGKLEQNGVDEEIKRIYGYNRFNTSKFEIADPTNPTDEDLYRFSLLSPAEKVIFLQREFNEESLIFKHLNVITGDERTIKTKGYTISSIRYTDDTIDQDNLIYLFEQSYFNANPLFKMASIDLIKYSYIVDGLGYKAGGISKIIANSAMLNLAVNSQENIVEKFTNYKNTLVNGVITNDDGTVIASDEVEDFIDKFARSHYEMITTSKFTKQRKVNNKTEKIELIKREEEILFNKCKQDDKLVVIPKTEQTKQLRDYLFNKNEDNNELGYIRIINSNKISEVYKIDENEDNIYLIPRPLLETNEITEYSIDSSRNRAYYPFEYYNEIIYGTAKQDAKAKYNKFKKDKTPKTQKPKLENSNDLQNLINSNNKIISAEVTDFVNKIKNKVLTGASDEYIIPFSGHNVSELFNNKEFIEQVINTENGDVIVGIKKLELSDLLSKPAMAYYFSHTNIYDVENFNNNARSAAKMIDIKEKKVLQALYQPGRFRVESNTINGRTYNKTVPTISLYSVQLRPDVQEEVNYDDEFTFHTDYSGEVTSININTGKRKRHNASSFTGGLIRDSEMVKVMIDDIIRFGKPQFNNEMERFKRTIYKYGADINSDESLSKIKMQVFLAAKRYYGRVADILLDELNNFKLSNGNVYSLSDPQLYKEIEKNSNDYERLIQVILDAYTFGNNFSNRLNLYVSDDNKYIQDALDSIKNSINKVKNNTIIHNAIQNIFNIYFADKYSNNPNMKQGIGLLTDTFGDADKLTFLFADVAETNNQLIQVISKYVQSNVMGAEIVDAPQAVKLYKEKIKSIIGDNKALFKKVIKNGKIVQDYNDRLLKDVDKLNQELDVIKLKYGESSIEYFKKQLEYDKFMAAHFQRPVKKSYYDEVNAEKDKALIEAPNLFAKYIELNTQIYDKKYQLSDENEEEERINQLNQKIAELLSPIDVNIHKRKDKETIKEIRAIREYNRNMAIISKKYYEKETDDDFDETLKKYREVIKRYDEEHSNSSLQAKLQNDEYKNAYDWIKANTITLFSDEAYKEINNEFKLLRKSQEENDILNLKESVLDELLIENPNRYDKQHILDGRLFTAEEKQRLKDEYYGQFENDYDSAEADASLIKDIPKTDDVYTSEFYDLFNGKLNPTLKKRKQELIKEINSILNKGLDIQGHINTNELFNNCTKEELIKLGELYKELRNIKNPKKSAERKLAIEQNVNFKTNDSEYEFQRVYAIQRFSNKNGELDKEMFKIWTNIFVDFEYDKDGNYVPVLDKSGNLVGNAEIYGYIEPKDKEKYLDKKKTAARHLVSEDIEFSPTEYYYDAEATARRDGKYKEWFEENHIFNPYTHKYEPLKIWTRMTPTINGKFNNEESYRTEAAGEYSRKKIKEEYINSNYNPDIINYIKGDANYDSNITLTSQEQQLRDYLNEIMRTFYKGTKYKEFIRQGNAPRRYKENIDLKFVGKQTLGVLGMTLNKREREWADELNYNRDFESVFTMLDEIRTKAYKPIPNKPTNATAEELEKYYEEVNKIKEENAKQEQDYISDDWYNIFADYIQQSVMRNNKDSLKNTAYLLLEYLRTNPAYKVNYRGNVKLDRSSTDVNPVAATTKQNNYYDMYETWLRRILFNQFKENHKLRPYADMLQNMASAKYMIFNITGGIANITTGFTNILGEQFSNMYWSKKDFHEANKLYRGVIPSLLRDMYKETSTNRTAAIIKKMNIVNFTEFTERREDETVVEFTKRIREHLYDFQNGGEHMMQNIAMLSLLNSNRIYKDINGNYTIGDINNYTQLIEEVALKQFLENDKELLIQFEIFKKDINKDVNKRKKYEEFRSNVIRDFFKEYGISKDEIKKYLELRDKLYKDKQEEFYKFKTLNECIHFDQKTGEITYDEEFSKDLVGKFKNKALSVNNKIHGVYNKIGAANIEKHWYGGIIMQYHKHIYPGIMKRWRIKGLYNEHRDSIEQGSYITLGKFLSTEIRDAISELKDKKQNNEELTAIESIQTLSRAIIDTFANAKFNWQFMEKWEKENCRRVIGDLCGMASAILIAIALYALTDDDDIKENNLLATCVYLSDRLYQESRMYTIRGLVNEGKTFWSSPVASEKLLEDLMSAMQITINWMSDPDFNINYTTGLYKGENKLWVKLRRNIPIYRVYDRLSRMTQNNNYYKIGSGNENMKLAKYVAEFINPEE